MKNPKIAIIHDYLTQYGGAEKTVEAIAELFPDAPIYTAFYNPSKVGGIFSDRKVITAGKGVDAVFSLFPILAKYFTFLVPFMFENFDLREYDIIISSSSSYAKGVLTNPNQLHISYIHTPPRFLYKYSVESTKRNAWYFKPFVMFVDHFLRMWDFAAAQRPDFLIANSATIRERIQKFYKRDSTVVYPPVEFTLGTTEKNNLEQPYYYTIGRLVAYKNIDLIIQAFNILGFPLKIGGTGPEEQRLRKIAKSNIKFLGMVSEQEKHSIIENSLGFVFAVKDEDFGIVVAEALAHGKPVLSHRSGGPTEIIRENRDGMFFDELNLQNLTDKLREFDEKVRTKAFDAESMKNHVAKFSKTRFQKELLEFINERWKEKSLSHKK